jgi:hypothetical protein
MKKLIFISLLFMKTHSFATGRNIDINDVRTLYQKSATSEGACRAMLEMLSDVDEKNPLLLGYKASGTMMMAKFVFSPFSKMSYFKKGKQMMEMAIEADKTCFELRFLRFVAQTNVPSFLGYHDRIENDKNFILKGYPEVTDIKLKEFVFPMLAKSKYLNTAEKKSLK